MHVDCLLDQQLPPGFLRIKKTKMNKQEQVLVFRFSYFFFYLNLNASILCGCLRKKQIGTAMRVLKSSAEYSWVLYLGGVSKSTVPVVWLGGR